MAPFYAITSYFSIVFHVNIFLFITEKKTYFKFFVIFLIEFNSLLYIVQRYLRIYFTFFFFLFDVRLFGL